MDSSIGVVLAIGGNALISIALNIQKYVHNQLNTSDTLTPLLATESTTPYWKVPFWWLGLSLMFLGELGNFAAYGFAPAVFISPLGTVALIGNAMIAPLFLHEEWRHKNGVGIFLSIVGTVLIVTVSSMTPDPIWSPHDIVVAMCEWSFIIYSIITSVLVLILLYLSHTRTRPFLLVDLMLVALFGGYTVLSTKAISTLLHGSLGVALAHPIFYGMALLLIVTAILQITYLNKSLSKFDSTRVVPTNFVLFTLSTIIGSCVLYKDADRMTLQNVGMVLLGVVFMFLGVWLITGDAQLSPSHSSTPPSPFSTPTERTMGAYHYDTLARSMTASPCPSQRSSTRASSYQRALFLEPYLRATMIPHVRSHTEGGMISDKDSVGSLDTPAGSLPQQRPWSLQGPLLVRLTSSSPQRPSFKG